MDSKKPHHSIGRIKSSSWPDFTAEDLTKGIKDNTESRKNYHTLCLNLLNLIIAADNIRLFYINISHFASDDFIKKIKELEINRPFDESLSDCAAIAETNRHKFVFFFEDQEQNRMQEITKKIYNQDGDQLNVICVMIVPTYEKMNELREIRYADEWPRVFFTCFDEIRQKAREINQEASFSLCGSSLKNLDILKKELFKTAAFTAEIKANIPVGKGTPPDHFKLRFSAPDLKNIIPGQFIMMRTQPLPHDHSPQKAPELKTRSDLKSSSVFSIEPVSYLKRPFGIHRSFYKNFSPHYLQNLHLPKTISSVLHTVFPHEFDIFYKVMKNGVGTKELTKAYKGCKIEMIGPLGKRFDLRSLHTQNIEEVHVIGGGVGMAPLVFMVQALRFFGFRVKAFIGLECIELLSHEDDYAESYVEDPKNVRLYVDDLLAAGVSENDIFVSCDREGTIHGSKIQNYRVGLISEYYEDYLSQESQNKKKTQNNRVRAFACGPTAMMKAVYRITNHYKIPLKVLMEKRMACGIGVCLSCICRTKTEDGREKYLRVCKDGPLFDAGEIEWSNEKS